MINYGFESHKFKKHKDVRIVIFWKKINKLSREISVVTSSISKIHQFCLSKMLYKVVCVFVGRGGRGASNLPLSTY
jgi:hypothetical protein